MGIFDRIRMKTTGSLKRFFRWPSLRVGLLIIFLIILFTANGVFWYLYYFSHKDIEENKAEERQKQWEINLNEKPLDEAKLKEEYSLKPEEKKENIKKESTLVSEKAGGNIRTVAKQNSNIKDSKQEIVEVKETADLNLITLPVTGKIITEFSKDTLIYSKTLNQWCVHKGIDIAADLGTPVKAALSGTVVEIKKDDPILGVVVVIDHGNGIKTLYGNLMSDKLVQKGKKVKKGEIIGGVGNTAPYESEDPPHLHFEIIKNNENIDPQQFFKNV